MYEENPWRPLAIEAIADVCGAFKDWVLCGGCSVALITGEDTRSHGDIDIGVYRSQLEECLHAIGRSQVFLCQGDLVPWDGSAVPQAVHDIWISDKQHTCWIMQVMVYDDDGDRVIYRRNPGITWPKSCHSIQVHGMRVLNPYISFLFKANRAEMEPKEMHDLMKLIEHGARQK